MSYSKKVRLWMNCDPFFICALAHFLFFLLTYFCCRNTSSSRQPELFLGRSERTYFVTVVLKLIDRGQYSKNEHLSETVAAAASILSYVEPSLVLPFVASRFHMALETVSCIKCIISFTSQNCWKLYKVRIICSYPSQKTYLHLWNNLIG